MTTIDGSTAQRLAALERRGGVSKRGGRRRPAEASRVLAAGAGTAAVLTMVAAMAQADQAAQILETPVFEVQSATTPQTFDVGVSGPPTVTQAPPARTPVVQTITIARPARAHVSNARTSASR